MCRSPWFHYDLLLPRRLQKRKYRSKVGKLRHGHPLHRIRVQGRKGKETWDSLEIAPQICKHHQFYENKGACPPPKPPTHTIRGGGGGVFLLEVQYSILKSLISTCVLSYVGSRRRRKERIGYLTESASLKRTAGIV